MVRIFSFLAVASMFGGSLLALLQTNVKRILAYSSIAHMGYVLVTLLATGKTALVASAYYLAAYAVTTLGAFGVISVLSGPEQDAQDLDEFRALAWKRPWLALVFTVMLLSLAGIPLTAGFIGKFYVVAAGIGSQLWLLITSLIVTSVISLVYYLRIVVTMYDTAEEPGLSLDLNSEQSLAAALILALLTVILILMGVYPSPLVDLIETSGPT
jgi:NADH-quinone oxidoreductase subunit N